VTTAVMIQLCNVQHPPQKSASSCC
jgi:hypothetical protein